MREKKQKKDKKQKITKKFEFYLNWLFWVTSKGLINCRGGSHRAQTSICILPWISDSIFWGTPDRRWSPSQFCETICWTIPWRHISFKIIWLVVGQDNTGSPHLLNFKKMKNEKSEMKKSYYINLQNFPTLSIFCLKRHYLKNEPTINE